MSRPFCRDVEWIARQTCGYECIAAFEGAFAGNVCVEKGWTMADVTNCKVAVLCGGWSDEREVSLTSGRASAQALLEAGFAKVDTYDIADREFVHAIADGGYDVAFVALHGR